MEYTTIEDRIENTRIPVGFFQNVWDATGALVQHGTGYISKRIIQK